MDALLVDDSRQDGEHTVSVAIGDSPIDLVSVRQRVRDLLAGCPQPVVIDAVCVADALATNAYTHAQAPKVIRVTLGTGGGTGLRVETDDASVLALPVVHDWPATTGLGMRLVSTIATSWGVERHPDRKIVWAEVDLETNPDH